MRQLHQFVSACLEQNADINLIKQVNTEVLKGTASEYLGDWIDYIKKYYDKYNSYPDVSDIPDYREPPLKSTHKSEFFLDTELNPDNIVLALMKLQFSKLTTLSNHADFREMQELKNLISIPTVFEQTFASTVVEDFDCTRYLVSNNRLLELGFPTYDNYTGGVEDGELLTILALPNVGKTTVLTQIAAKAYQNGKRVLFATMEMSRASILNRIDAILGGFNAKHFRLASKNNVSKDWLIDIQNDILNMHKDLESKGGCLTVMTPRFVSQLENEAEKQYKLMQPYDIILTDNFYLMLSENGESGYSKDAANLNALKNIATGQLGKDLRSFREIDPTRVITTSQLDAKNTSATGLDAIKKTVAIAESSDTMWFLTRLNNNLLVDVQKNRSAEAHFKFEIYTDYNVSSMYEVKSIGTPMVTPYLSTKQPTITSLTTRGSTIV